MDEGCGYCDGSHIPEIFTVTQGCGMKRFLRILLWIVIAIIAYCVISFCVGLITGLYKSYKIKEETKAAKTFFGITLDEELDVPEDRIIGYRNYDDYRYRRLCNDFYLSEFCCEFSLEDKVVVLDRKFYNSDLVVALTSAHDGKVRAIAACMSWDERQFDHRVDGFGEADETCEKIRRVLEEKYNCRMNPLSIEPTFAKSFIIRPGNVKDRLPTRDKVMNDVYISRKSCFMASPNFFATIFVIGYKQNPKTEPTYDGQRWDDGKYHNKDYLVLFINTPDLDSISAREHALAVRDREMQDKKEKEREHKEAYDVL